MIWTNQQQEQCITNEQRSLENNFRLIMTRFAILSRAYISSVLTGLGDPSAIALKLFNLPSNMKFNIETAFGRTVGDEIIRLLSVNLIYLQNLVNAVSSNDTGLANENIKSLYQNTDYLAKYLSQINPYWNENQWKVLLYNYNKDLIDDIESQKVMGFNNDLDIFDKLLLDALEIGKYFADGIGQYVSAPKK
ncbi:hypothetical protein [Sinanaerobacter chloroacetimidivorans]|uniref:Uncharacterized protein n=1 Tax=Sinanaerobacter chloroacetimidivorans TaxID=2818044 RepID=A0A8J7W3X7_9FIRM|nr:hypothetical protein [Sinanaerobacter chloroacetimidivorans]MBR0598490.1 hypothetical protein [Sinanaerobacter chloroacetimidivorans]